MIYRLITDPNKMWPDGAIDAIYGKCYGRTWEDSMNEGHSLKQRIEIGDSFELLGTRSNWSYLYCPSRGFTIAIFTRRLGLDFVQFVNYNDYWAKLNE